MFKTTKSKLIFVVVKKYSAFCVVKSMSVTERGLVHEYFILPFTFSRVSTNWWSFVEGNPIILLSNVDTVLLFNIAKFIVIYLNKLLWQF